MSYFPSFHHFLMISGTSRNLKAIKSWETTPPAFPTWWWPITIHIDMWRDIYKSIITLIFIWAHFLLIYYLLDLLHLVRKHLFFSFSISTWRAYLITIAVFREINLFLRISTIICYKLNWIWLLKYYFWFTCQNLDIIDQKI